MNKETTLMRRVVRCNVCGLIYPTDYFKLWGIKYGKGLGKDPCCEGLQSNYFRPPVPSYPQYIPPEKIMHPIHYCRGAVSLVDVNEDEYKDNIAILAVDDQNMQRRIEIIRTKQAKKTAVVKTAISSITKI